LYRKIAQGRDTQSLTLHLISEAVHLLNEHGLCEE